MINDLQKVYEDENILVIDKPAGLVVHRDRRGNPKDEKTLAGIILVEYPQLAPVGEPFVSEDGENIPRPGIVHRLDKDTSGVMVLAKNQETFLNLKKQFQEHAVKKTYQTIVCGAPKKDFGVIDLPIGRSRKDARVRVAGRGAVGKLRQAETAYQVKERFKGYSLLEVTPKTGRTHQIRVHLKALGFPIVGDSLYSPKKGGLPGLGRQALHAGQIEFFLPNGETACFNSPLPLDMKTALDYLKML